MEYVLKNNNFLRLTALEDLQKHQKGDPFKILIGTILSSRTRDEKTTEALIRLFKKFNGIKEVANADIEEIKNEIVSVGFYNIKAKRIKQVANIICNDFQGKVPNKVEDLLLLPGVGRKTANCVMVYAFQKSAIPVDVHVHRISNRLGLVKTTNPEETERKLIDKIDEKYWIKVNSIFVRYGQNVCLPIKPKCNYCSLNNICKYYKQIEKKKEEDKKVNNNIVSPDKKIV